MFIALIMFQTIVISIAGYVHFALGGPCPEKYHGSLKCYYYTYRTTDDPSNRQIKRVYLKKPWVTLDDVPDNENNG